MENSIRKYENKKSKNSGKNDRKKKTGSKKNVQDEIKQKDTRVNGLLIGSNFVPEEVLLEIFSFVDCNSLLSCQLVCKKWKFLIQQFVWHKKAEQTIGYRLLLDNRTPWIAYYTLCAKMPFNKNLIKNHSGEKGPKAHWKLPPINGIKWFTESPTIPPLPDDTQFTSGNHCFVTSPGMTWKYQIVDLISEGFSKYVLDKLQPPIKISEWYCCKDAPALYLCDIELLSMNGQKKRIIHRKEGQISETTSDHYTFSRVIKNGEQNKWYKYEHEFRRYGKGLRKIKFIHGGRDKHHNDENNYNNDFGSKMTRACVTVDIPSLDYGVISTLPHHA